MSLRARFFCQLKGFFEQFSTGIHSLPQGDFCYGLRITAVPFVAGEAMHHPDWVAEFRQKLVPDHSTFRPQKSAEETSPQVTRWLQLADQLLSTDIDYDDAT